MQKELLTKKRKTKRPDIETLDALYSCNTTKKIAEMYNVPENTVKSWIFRYRKALEAEEVKC